MPPINTYNCTKCDLAFHKGFGGYTYVLDDQGKKVVAGHPVEHSIVSEVLGREVSWDKLHEEERVGFNSDCICKDCLEQFEMDVKKEERKCPKCKSGNVATAQELVGQPCPKCKEGTFESQYTGMIS